MRNITVNTIVILKNKKRSELSTTLIHFQNKPLTLLKEEIDTVHLNKIQRLKSNILTDEYVFMVIV